MFNGPRISAPNDVDRFASDHGAVRARVKPAQPRCGSVPFADEILDADAHGRVRMAMDGDHEATKTLWAVDLPIAEALMVKVFRRHHGLKLGEITSGETSRPSSA
jgi:hypothetical protein